MAVCWSFAMLLLLTLLALVTFTQPVFQPPAAPGAASAISHAGLESAVGAMERRAPPRRAEAPLTSEASGENATSAESMWNNLRGRRRCRPRKLIQGGDSRPSSRRIDAAMVSSISPVAGPPAPRDGILANSRRLSRRRASSLSSPAAAAASAHFESDRMVPTGPNPLHNSNRSQVIFP